MYINFVILPYFLGLRAIFHVDRKNFAFDKTGKLHWSMKICNMPVLIYLRTLTPMPSVSVKLFYVTAIQT